VLVSDHGFGSAAFRRINMQRLAAEIGLGGGATATSALGRFGITKRRVYKYVGWLVPEGRLRNAERLARDRALRDVRGKLVKLHDYIGGVWIHRASRGGPVPDDEVPAFRDRIVERLGAVEHEGTASRLVTRVVAREELFEGDRVASAPDVVFFVDDRYGLDPTPREQGLVYRAEPPNTGTHRSDGIFLIAGPDVVPGRPEPPLRIEDAAPTILHLLGLPVPAAMDGRVVAEALSPEFNAAHPVTVSHDTYGEGGVGRWDSEDEEEEIMERLRGIGYVE
jgi:predicted AlkP superfamily phosphohydrolase/phosphomutase